VPGSAPRWFTRPKTVNHLSLISASRWLYSQDSVVHEMFPVRVTSEFVVVNHRSAEKTAAVSHVLQTLLDVAVLCHRSSFHHVHCVWQVRHRWHT